MKTCESRRRIFYFLLFAVFGFSHAINAKNTYAPPADVRGDDILQRCRDAVKKAQEIKEEIYQQGESRDQQQQQPLTNESLTLYNELLILMSDILSEASLISQVHPNEPIRKDAETCEQEASKFMTDISLDNAVYQALSSTNTHALDDEGLRMLEQTLRDFAQSGVDKDEETRNRIKALKEELVTVSQEFNQNISNDRFYIELSDAKDLEGLPADYIESHKQPDGKYRITTSYPDYVPFMKYAKNDAARKELRFKYLNRGEKNGPVLDAMIKKRAELARLLNYDSYANYIVEDKMIKNAHAIYAFIDRVSNIAKPGADREYQELLNFKKQIDENADRVEGHESGYLEEGYKKAQFGFDSQEARSYFAYDRVRDGLLKITGELFNIRYEKVEDAPVWHESVDTYDVFDDEGKLGRIYLDMHPRDGKYSHAAQFTVRNGLKDRQYPEGALVCNFPDPKNGDGTALMEHSDVTTFFHEFGHLLHHIFAGNQKWVAFSGVATEWDFVEAPSQLLEEWAWSPDVLARFALHVETNEPIPTELVNKMRAAEEFGKAIAARQQMFYAALSVNYYDRDPETFDPMELLKELQAKYSYYPYEEGTHFIYNFGHLDGYSAMYYTYMWSLVLAKDMFEPFKQNGLMNTDVAARYRDYVLKPGGTKDAAVLVEDFLGRPFQFDAFEKWLTEPAMNF